MTAVEGGYPYVIFREHYNKKPFGRGAICSAGPLYRNPNLREVCKGCNIFWDDYSVRQDKKTKGDSSKGPNRLSMTDKFAWGMFDYGIWYQKPRFDNDGNPVVSQKTGKQYYDWEMANPNDPSYAQYVHKQGHLLPWPMGKTHKEYLLDYHKKTIQNDCAGCGSQGTIRAVSRHCGNPNCEALIYEANNTTITPETRDKIDLEPFTCSTCGETHYTTELIECAGCAAKGTMPVRATIFDVDLEVSASKTPDGKQTALIVLNRSAPRPIQIADPELLARVQKPMDLLAKFTPTPMEEQEKIWPFRDAPTTAAQPPVMGQTPMMQPPMMGQQGVVPPHMMRPQQVNVGQGAGYMPGPDPRTYGVQPPQPMQAQAPQAQPMVQPMMQPQIAPQVQQAMAPAAAPPMAAPPMPVGAPPGVAMQQGAPQVQQQPMQPVQVAGPPMIGMPQAQPQVAQPPVTVGLPGAAAIAGIAKPYTGQQ